MVVFFSICCSTNSRRRRKPKPRPMSRPRPSCQLRRRPRPSLQARLQERLQQRARPKAQPKLQQNPQRRPRQNRQQRPQQRPQQRARLKHEQEQHLEHLSSENCTVELQRINSIGRVRCFCSRLAQRCVLGVRCVAQVSGGRLVGLWGHCKHTRVRAVCSWRCPGRWNPAAVVSLRGKSQAAVLMSCIWRELYSPCSLVRSCGTRSKCCPRRWGGAGFHRRGAELSGSALYA